MAYVRPRFPFPRAGVELAPDVKPPSPVVTIAMLREDKAVFDAAQAWLSARAGRRVTQWEAFTVILAEALGHPDSSLRGMPAPP